MGLWVVHKDWIRMILNTGKSHKRFIFMDHVLLFHGMNKILIHCYNLLLSAQLLITVIGEL